jgi:hypothetical protein
MIFGGVLIVCGIFLVGSGMWSSFDKKHPWDTVGAFLALVGLAASILGILRICVPHFFT